MSEMKRVSKLGPSTGTVTFQGKVDERGLKQGRGVQVTSEFVLKANFVDDLAEGQVELVFPEDKTVALANMTKGKLSGPYSLFDSKGREVFNGPHSEGK